MVLNTRRDSLTWNYAKKTQMTYLNSDILKFSLPWVKEGILTYLNIWVKLPMLLERKKKIKKSHWKQHFIFWCIHMHCCPSSIIMKQADFEDMLAKLAERTILVQGFQKNPIPEYQDLWNRRACDWFKERIWFNFWYVTEYKYLMEEK